MSRLLTKLPLLRPTSRILPSYRFSSSKTSTPHSSPSSTIPSPRLSYSSLLPSSLPSVLQNALLRNAPITSSQITQASELASIRLTKHSELNTLRHSRGLLSEQVRLKTPGALEKATALKTDLKVAEEELRAVEVELMELAMLIPNETHPDVPLGAEENAVEIERIGPVEGEEGSLVGVVDPNRDHLIIGRELGIIDFESGRLVSGAGFYFLRKEGTVLSHALVGYALDLAMKAGFEAASCPDVVRTDIGTRCGFAPRERVSLVLEGQEEVVDASSPSSLSPTSSPEPLLSSLAASQSYHIIPSTPLSVPLTLAGTAEIPLAGANLLRTFYPSELPLRTVGVGKAYRTEIGAADARGLYRVHQFEKVELFVVCQEENSEREMERLRVVQRGLVRGLGLGVRVLDMPTEELGAAAYRKYDMEAWMPGRGSWGEISSTSNCTDYQSRRLHISYQTPTPTSPSDSSKPTTFAHTLNGTAAAIPRLIVALLENGVVFSSLPMSIEDKYQEGLIKKKGGGGKSGRVVKKQKGRKGEGEEVEEERKETLDEGLRIVGMKLPEALKRFWIGPEMMGSVPIEWV